MSMRWLVGMLVVAGLAGCESPEAIQRVDESYYQANTLAAGAVLKSAEGWRQTEDSRHELVTTVIDQDVDNWLDGFKNSDGRLVNDAGQPISKADVKRMMVERDKRMAKEWADHQRNAEGVQTLHDLGITMKGTADKWFDKKAEWNEKRKQTATLMNHALNSLISIGGGLGLGAAAL